MDGWEVYRTGWGCEDLTQLDLACFVDSKWIFCGKFYFQSHPDSADDREILAAVKRYCYSVRTSWSETMRCGDQYLIMRKVPTSIHDTSLALWRSCALLAIVRGDVVLPREILRDILSRCLCD